MSSQKYLEYKRFSPIAKSLKEDLAKDDKKDNYQEDKFKSVYDKCPFFMPTGIIITKNQQEEESAKAE